jgi:hypothetical protein
MNVVLGFRKEGRTEMLETNVIGNKEWTRKVLTEADIRVLEDIDCEIRIRSLQQRQGYNKARTHGQLVEQDGDKVPTHCEHGIPLNRKCGVCRALFG